MTNKLDEIFRDVWPIWCEQQRFLILANGLFGEHEKMTVSDTVTDQVVRQQMLNNLEEWDTRIERRDGRMKRNAAHIAGLFKTLIDDYATFKKPADAIAYIEEGSDNSFISSSVFFNNLILLRGFFEMNAQMTLYAFFSAPCFLKQEPIYSLHGQKEMGYGMPDMWHIIKTRGHENAWRAATGATWNDEPQEISIETLRNLRQESLLRLQKQGITFNESVLG